MEIESRRSHSLRQYLSRISAWIESTAIVSDGRSSSSYAICMNWLVRSLPCLNRMTWSRVFFLASRGTNSIHALVGSKVQKVYRRASRQPADNGSYALLRGKCVAESFRRARYAYKTASKGGAISTPQNGKTSPSTMGEKTDAQRGIFAVLLMMYGWSSSPSSTAITA